MSDGVYDWLSVSGVWAYESIFPCFARGLCGSMEDASLYLWGDRSCDLVWNQAIYFTKRSKKSWKMAGSFVCRNDCILCVPDGAVFSGRCTDELLLWMCWISNLGNDSQR